MEICIQRRPFTSGQFALACTCSKIVQPCVLEENRRHQKFVIVKSEPKSKPNIWFLHFQANYFWAVGWNLWAECKLLWVQPAASFKAEQISAHFAKVWKIPKNTANCFVIYPLPGFGLSNHTFYRFWLFITSFVIHILVCAFISNSPGSKNLSCLLNFGEEKRCLVVCRICYLCTQWPHKSNFCWWYRDLDQRQAWLRIT